MARACRRWRGEIGAYIVGALEPTATDALEHHLARCADCRTEYAELAPVRALLDHCTDGLHHTPFLGNVVHRDD